MRRANDFDASSRNGAVVQTGAEVTSAGKAKAAPYVRVIRRCADDPRLRVWALAATLMLLSLLATSCGYRTAGRASNLPTQVNTIAIPVFVNQTQTYRIETLLTSAVVREFNTRSRYRIVSDPRESDATLTGYVTSAQLAPLTYDSQTGRASSALVTVTMRVTLTERDGRILYQNANYVFREQYQISRELSSFFAEESPAMERLSRDFARTLVSNVLEAY